MENIIIGVAIGFYPYAGDPHRSISEACCKGQRTPSGDCTSEIDAHRPYGFLNLKDLPNSKRKLLS